MSFDIQQMHISDDSPEAVVLEAIISRDHVTPAEAIRRALRGLVAERNPKPGQPLQKRKAQKVTPLTDEELTRFDQLCPAFKVLEDVPDETWHRISKGRMRTEGFPVRA